MDFDKLYDMFCEYYKDDGSNDAIMKGRIEKAFLKYAQTQVKNCNIADVVGQSEQLKCNCTEPKLVKEFIPTECCSKCNKVV